MANGRALFTPPAFSPLQFGLLSAAVDRTADAPSHWEAGITWPSYCPPDSEVTYDPCLTVVRDPGDDEQVSSDPPDTAADKTPTTEYFLRGAIPFAVYARIDCSPPGFWDNAQTHAENALVRTEGRSVARTFATGEAVDENGLPIETVFPHLQADTPLIDSTGATLQTMATVLTDTPVDIVEGIGMLESALGTCYGGQGVIHTPDILGTSLASQSLITRRGAQLASPLGHAYAVSSGYPGESPSDVSESGAVWVYATGQVFYLRSAVTVHGQIESFDRDKNTLEALVERRYVLGWDCCHFAVPITTGGVTAGEVESPAEEPAS